VNAPDFSKGGFAALLELAESKFHAWHLKELRPELERRISELEKQNLTSGGLAVCAIGIYREFLEREVRQRIGLYAAVAREAGSSEMLSKGRIEEYRDRIMTTVGHCAAALKDHIERDARAAGDLPESALPNEHRYLQLEVEILDVVNAELRPLEAEGKPAGRTEVETSVMRANPSSRGLALKADAEANRAVAQAVESFGSSWTDRLTEVCEALDQRKLPLPRSKKWKGKECSDWTDESDQDPGLLVQVPSNLRVISDVPKQEDTKQRMDEARKGDGTLLGEKRLVSFGTAEQYLGISERQRQKLVKSGALEIEGQGQNRKVTTKSLKAYLPPDIPN
jgi:hypothetical protein